MPDLHCFSPLSTKDFTFSRLERWSDPSLDNASSVSVTRSVPKHNYLDNYLPNVSPSLPPLRSLELITLDPFRSNTDTQESPLQSRLMFVYLYVSPLKQYMWRSSLILPQRHSLQPSVVLSPDVNVLLSSGATTAQTLSEPRVN